MTQISVLSHNSCKLLGGEKKNEINDVMSGVNKEEIAHMVLYS